MKKIILFSALFLVAGTASFAQSFNFGLKAGLNIAELKSDLAEEENRLGYQVGVFARVGAAGVYLQPELYLGSKGGKFPSASGVVTGDEKISFTTLDLPILLGSKVGVGPVNVRFMAGPIISFVVNKDEPVATASQNVKNFRDYKDNAWGVQGGAGIDISKLTFDVRYEVGVSNLNKSDQYEQKSNLWHISLGYKIL
ncbi:porin family protein [Hufsiella ginkgonis]|uniref:Outer membrane beta-barrel protein n=1 Tax=Hufsiella ginkgonis TaxID=2695274 RepID=A0A7K1XV41_9SPHI|nr:porin family protein [Hufsiella ginkgonis]MXV14873.1 outer membrane beta-barrel protein [Hufsiella ginkgonis]